MDLIPINSTIHYKCALDIHHSKNDGMTALRRLIRSWCLRKTRKFSNEDLHSAWFFRGDSSQHRVGSYLFRTSVNIGSSTLEEPDNWALEVIHADSKNKSRKWSIEITLSRKDESCIRFVTTSKHWMNEGYIGSIPTNPRPSVPAYVRSIVEANDFVCRKGDELVLREPKEIDVGGGKELFERIISNERFLPAVVVSKSSSSETYNIDTKALHEQLLGNANVYLLSNSRAVSEFNYFSGQDLKCMEGSLRIYMPKVRLGHSSDPNRHRYYSERQLSENDFETIASEIIVGLSRNARAFTLNDIVSIQDVISQGRKHRLKQLSSHYNINKEEELSLLWEEVEDLNNKISEYNSLISLYESENEELKQENSNLKWKASQAEELRSDNDELRNIMSSFESLDRLPSSLSEVVDFIERAYPSRIKFTERGRKSAQEYVHGGEVYPQAWQILRAMATVLHKLMFEDQSNDLESLFKDQSGFDLAMTEGRQTKRNSSLMRLRKDSYDNKEVDITPHVKYGNRTPSLLRVHFYPDNERQLLVIGHCGEHLDNFSTRSVG